MKQILLGLLVTVAAAAAYTGDDKFIKKYAMMKVYESCFGPEVVKEVRKEMKAAAIKCAGLPGVPVHHQQSPPPPSSHHHASSSSSSTKYHPAQLNQLGQRHKPQTQVNRINVEHHPELTHGTESVSHVAPLQVDDHTKTQGIDLTKLQQAILAGYNKHITQQQQQQQAYLSQSQYRPPPQLYQQPQQPPAYNNFFYPQQPQMYQPPQPQYIPNPYYQPQPPVFPYQYYSGQRGSRDLDVHGQLETIASSMTVKVRNVTCIMQELGYLDHNLEPDYQRMVERIGRLPVSEELKKDMVEGVDFCKQFSQCLPEDKKDKIVREMVRPMFFFRCYKHKKLEACIMKDVRERYAASEEMAEDNLSGSENRSAKVYPKDNMTTAIYEFLYGDENGSDSLM